MLLDRAYQDLKLCLWGNPLEVTFKGTTMKTNFIEKNNNLSTKSIIFDLRGFNKNYFFVLGGYPLGVTPRGASKKS